MELLLDIGNSRIKWASSQHGALEPSTALSYQSGNIAQTLHDIAGHITKPDRVIVSNVAGEKIAALLTEWAQTNWEIKIEALAAEKNAYGVRNAYVHPDRLGADRWAALIAVRQRIEVAACIVDCGTAITIDVLSGQGEHLGGLIVPGIQMMRNSLASGTKGVRSSENAMSKVSLLARDTGAAVFGGTLYAAVAVIDRVISDVSEAMNMELTCVLTGGNAPEVKPLLAHACIYEPDLVLQGLARVAAGKL